MVVYGDGICGLRLVVVYGSGDVYGGVVVYGNDDDDGAAAVWQPVNRTRNSKVLDARTSNLTRRWNRKFNKANTEKIMQRLRLVRIWWTNPNFFCGFFVDYRYEEQTRSKLLKNCKISPSNLEIWYHLIEAKVSCLSMRWWISLWWKSTLTIRLRTCEDVAP